MLSNVSSLCHRVANKAPSRDKDKGCGKYMKAKEEGKKEESGGCLGGAESGVTLLHAIVVFRVRLVDRCTQFYFETVLFLETKENCRRFTKEHTQSTVISEKWILCKRCVCPGTRILL